MSNCQKGTVSFNIHLSRSLSRFFQSVSTTVLIGSLCLSRALSLSFYRSLYRSLSLYTKMVYFSVTLNEADHSPLPPPIGLPTYLFIQPPIYLSMFLSFYSSLRPSPSLPQSQSVRQPLNENGLLTVYDPSLAV